MYYVYILRCCDGTLYTGITTDLRRRVKAHNAGTGAKYTRSRRPVIPVYHETQPDKPAALRRELALKALSRREKLALIAASGIEPGAYPGEDAAAEIEKQVRSGEI